VAQLPFVGGSVSGYWQAIAADPQRIAQDLRPLVKPVREFLLAFSAGVGSGILEFALALLMASLLYVWGEDLGAVLNRVALRLGGESGRRQLVVVASTVRGVFNGVIGTAAAQALFAMIGFWIAGVPGVFLLGIGTFFLSVVPGGPVLLWLPATVWLYASGAAGWAIFMALWGFVVISGSDNVIRPLLIGQGVSAPRSDLPRCHRRHPRLRLPRPLHRPDGFGRRVQSVSGLAGDAPPDPRGATEALFRVGNDRRGAMSAPRSRRLLRTPPSSPPRRGGWSRRRARSRIRAVSRLPVAPGLPTSPPRTATSARPALRPHLGLRAEAAAANAGHGAERRTRDATRRPARLIGRVLDGLRRKEDP
jgi:hypothetical protein